MRSLILRLIPGSAIRFAGQLQFKVPALRPIINGVASLLVRSGTIQRGPGAGLKFNSTGCNPGYLAGTSEPLEQTLVAKYSTPGCVVYDVGANAGFYALLSAKAVGTNGQVFAFEPTPLLATRLRQNADANGFDQIKIVEKAVCDVDGRVGFGIVGDLSVNNSLASSESAESLEVEATTLDTFSSNHPAPSLILMDIEGAEVEALKGGLKTISESLPIMMIEVHWLGAKFTDFFNAELMPLGYTLSTYSGDPIPNGPVRYHALLLPKPA